MRAALILLIWAAPLWAETLPPRDAALRETLEARGIATDMTYVASASDIAAPKPPPPEPVPFLPSGSVSAWWVLGALALGLAVWLRFGGAGILTRRAPEEGGKLRAPDHWQVETLPASDLLDQIAAMEDRTQALVRLLRHCLLQAAEESRTRLARSDTEREAFARLPGARPGLALILQAAELAHYGGRPVSDQGFAEALAAGRTLMRGAHA